MKEGQKALSETIIGRNIQRKEAWDKVTGAAKYTADEIRPGVLYAKLLTSSLAHAEIIKIDISEAQKAPGIHAILTGEDSLALCGSIIEDRPPLAKGKVRYFGEPVALVIANSEKEAQYAVELINAEYSPLPVVNSVSDALKPDAVLVHEYLGQYIKAIKEVYPEPNSNIANRVKIRKGDMAKGWSESEIVVEGYFKLPQSDHIAMETRACIAEIKPDGNVIITTSTQGPHATKELISHYFRLDPGKVIVKTPLVGGGFGGKAAIQLEVLGYMATKAVNGRPVKLVNTREEDMVSFPCHLGLEAWIKLGSSKDGVLKAIEMTYGVDTGAYSDIGPRLAKAIAVDGTGPYRIENVFCDSLCVYTNHPVATSFRGFGHSEYTFCIERMLDKLAFALNMDPIDIRFKNLIMAGDTNPTQVKMTESNLGNLQACLEKLRNLINWDEGMRLEIGENKVRAKGLSCLWKTSNSPTDAISGIFLTFNCDGSININSGVVEYGPGMKTTLAQILAEKMKMPIDKIYVKMEVDTQTAPEHWKTVASMTTYMAGRAVLRAAEDLIRQLKNLAAIILKSPPEDLEVADQRVYLKQDPEIFIEFKNIVHGYKHPGGNSVEGHILGHGSFIMNHLTPLNKETGQGKSGPYWTVGAQAVEVEFDTKEYTYRLIKAATVIDAGRVLNPKTTRGVLTGGMSMGLGLASREAFTYDENGRMQTTSLRSYKVMHIGEEPEFLVDFVETPQVDAPYHARGLAEHGIVGIPGALANALSAAAQIDIMELPITPESMWLQKTGGESLDSL